MKLFQLIIESIKFSNLTLFEKSNRFAILMFSTIVFPNLPGYCVRIMRGGPQVPDTEKPFNMLIEGIIFMIIGSIYMIIPVIICGLLFSQYDNNSILKMLSLETNPADYIIITVSIIWPSLVIFFIFIVFFGLIALFGMIRVARTEKVEDAFKFLEIISTIQKIGWIKSLCIMVIIYCLIFIFYTISLVTLVIPVVGWIICFVPVTYVILFSSKLITLLYDDCTKSNC